MAIFRKLLTLALVGAVLGDVVATLIARAFIPWYQTPGSMTQGAQQICNLAVVTRGTIDQVVHYQVIGAVVGALLLLVGGGLVLRLRSHRVPAAPSTPAAG